MDALSVPEAYSERIERLLTLRYAVLFRTHMWDPFIARQFERLRAQVGSGDVFIVANNTSGHCPSIAGLPFVNFKESDIEAMGYARAGAGELLWYNVDYALYFFMQQKPDYDYYLLFEYDVVVNMPLDALIEAIAASGTDLVGLTEAQPISEWRYLSSCEGIYPRAEVRKMLFPLGVFSKRMVKQLSERRLSLSRQLAAGEIAQWPHCEAFMTTEAARAGFRIEEFAAYGSTEKFSFAPAYLEQDLAMLSAESFIHPVLDTPRYIVSTVKYEWKPERYFLPSSDIRQRLRRFPLRAYAKPLGLGLMRRLSRLPGFVSRKLGKTVRRDA